MVSCSVIATASIGGFVQSANATEQFGTKNSQSNLGTVLIAGNVSNGGGGNVSNAGGGNVSNGGGGNVSNGGGPNVSNGGGKDVGGDKGKGDKDKDKDKGGKGTTDISNGGGPDISGGKDNSGKDKGGKGISNISNGGGGDTSNGGGGFTAGPNRSNGGGSGFKSGFSSSQLAAAKGMGDRFSSAMGKHSLASAALAEAEAKQGNASSRNNSVRYGREPGDIAACGCPNADVVGSNNTTPSPELLAARAAEAEAAAELAAAKAAATQFLESVKSGGGSTSDLTIW